MVTALLAILGTIVALVIIVSILTGIQEHNRHD